MAESFEKIEELKKRANISYEEAKILLEKHNGDILEALIELEKDKKINNNTNHVGNFKQKVKQLFRAGNRTKLVVTRNGDTVVNVPVNFVLLSLLVSIHLVIVSLVIIFITGCKMSIKKSEGEVMNVDDVIVDLSKKVKTAAKSFTSEESDTKVNTTKTDDNGYSEHTVE